MRILKPSLTIRDLTDLGDLRILNQSQIPGNEIGELCVQSLCLVYWFLNTKVLKKNDFDKKSHKIRK